MVNSPFRIDILDASDNAVGDGPLTNILQIDDVRILDKIGQLTFVMPASDPKVQYITAGRNFDVYDETDGYLGRFIFNKMTFSDTDGRAMLIVQTWSILKELVYNIAGFAREYAASQVETIVDDLVTDVSGWATSTGTSLGTANVTYQGQTIYQGIEELAKRWGLHFRLGTGTRVLEFDTFGDVNSTVRLTNLSGQSDAYVGTETAIIKSIKKMIATDEVFNRVIAVGAGNGAAQLNLLDNEVGDFYTVDSRTRSNGQDETYIEDVASQTAFGIREVVLVFDQVRPIANTATAKTQAATELLKNAERWLNRYKDEREQYDNLTVYGLKTDVNVGDKVNVRYKGLDENGALYIDVDSDFWVMEVTRQRTSTGERSHVFKVVNVDRAEMTDQDIMASAVKAIHSEKLWIKPSVFSQSDTYTDTIQNGGAFYTDKDAEFTLTFDDTVTDITRVVLEWQTKPLYSLTSWDEPNDIVTGASNPTTPHTHTIGITPTIGLFNVVTSPNYPSDVSMEINGVNVDNHVDIDYVSGGTGEWNSASQNTALSVKMDITDYILGVAGGIYQTFTIKLIANIAVTRDISVPHWTTNTPQNSQVGNAGFVEMKILTQGVAMGIYKS
jgi:hypothetical protein